MSQQNEEELEGHQLDHLYSEEVRLKDAIGMAEEEHGEAWEMWDDSLTKLNNLKTELEALYAKYA